MSKGYRIGLAVVAVLVVVGAIANRNEPNTSNPSPNVATTTQTDPILTNIEKETDCGVLQAIFDNYDASNHPQKIAYMRAADARMSARGCY